MYLCPILGRIKETPECRVFVIGVYSGASKLANTQEYLQEVIVDMEAVSQSGIVYNVVHFSVALPFICDTHSRVLLKRSKGPFIGVRGALKKANT